MLTDVVIVTQDIKVAPLNSTFLTKKNEHQKHQQAIEVRSRLSCSRLVHLDTFAITMDSTTKPLAYIHSSGVLQISQTIFLIRHRN